MQMHYARRGVVTEEMAFVAARENMPVDFVVSEVRSVLRHSPHGDASLDCAASTLVGPTRRGLQPTGREG